MLYFNLVKNKKTHLNKGQTCRRLHYVVYCILVLFIICDLLSFDNESICPLWDQLRFYFLCAAGFCSKAGAADKVSYRVLPLDSDAFPASCRAAATAHRLSFPQHQRTDVRRSCCFQTLSG